MPSCLSFLSIGILSTELDWFQSYLSSHTQWMDLCTPCCAVQCTQRSVLGPFYSHCTPHHDAILLVGTISVFIFMRLIGQWYVTFETSSVIDLELKKCRLEAFARDIDSLMPINRLRLNKDRNMVRQHFNHSCAG